VFQLYERAALMEMPADEAVHERYFKQLWRKHFPEVKIPQRNSFTQCDMCVRCKRAADHGAREARARLTLENCRVCSRALLPCRLAG